MRQWNALNRNQTGISLLEVLLSLSIIAIILVMATRYFFVANNNNKINTTVSQVGGLVAAVNTWKGIKTTYEGLSVQALYDAGQLNDFPGLDDGSTSSVTLKNLWGGTIDVSEEAGGTGTSQASIVISALPTAGDCQALENAYSGSTCSSDHAFTYVFPDTNS